jgi:hypothetical protein
MLVGEAPDSAALVAVPEGRGYRIESPPSEAMVTPVLAAALKRVLEAFAADAGFDDGRRVSVAFGRGIFGHHRVGRAADIYGVGGFELAAWKARWDRASRHAGVVGGSEGERVMQAERHANLGWRLYKTMADRGRWSQPYGYPIQLFGPWTRSEGPWKYISDRLLFAHRDHIHVAK